MTLLLSRQSNVGPHFLCPSEEQRNKAKQKIKLPFQIMWKIILFHDSQLNLISYKQLSSRLSSVSQSYATALISSLPH